MGCSRSIIVRVALENALALPPWSMIFKTNQSDLTLHMKNITVVVDLLQKISNHIYSLSQNQTKLVTLYECYFN
jgi:uncharacterized membrane protein YjjP (DUF1212 family)